MVLRKLLRNRLFHSSPAATPQRRPPISSPASAPQNAAKMNFHRDYLNSTDSSSKGFFRPFLNRRAIKQLPDFLSIPVGEKLREALIRINGAGERIKLPDRLQNPANLEKKGSDSNRLEISVEDARKVLRLNRIEKFKESLQEIPESSIPYLRFLQICVEVCGNREEGFEFARMLDESGNVIVLGNIVFLRPQQITKSMENLIIQSIVLPNDPRREELKELERQKASMDRKARAQVRAELYCGLGFLAAQTIGFMRLTFWELSWDVMEPICYFVTSLHFGLAYSFFLRTSVEPSYEAYFQHRFKTKQKKLMEAQNFDIEKYNDLVKALYPSESHKL